MKIFQALILLLSMVLVGCVANTSADTPSEEARYEMPPQWTEQERVWLAWVPAEETFYQPPEQTAEQLAIRAEIVAKLSETIDVTVMVPPASVVEAETALLAAGADMDRVNYYEQEMVEYAIRDPGPLFVSNGKDLKVRMFGWDCYGYSYPLRDPSCYPRGELGRLVADDRGLEVEQLKVRSEGGAIEVSSDLMIAFKDAHEWRNPKMTVPEIEKALLEAYGKDKMIWLDRTPYADYGGQKIGPYYGWGANGHTDEYVRFVSDTTVLITQPDSNDTDTLLARADAAIMAQNIAQLKAATDLNGEPLTVIEMPHPDLDALKQIWPMGPWITDPFPSMFRDHEEAEEIYWVPMASYMNFLISNEVVLVQAFWSEGLPESIRQDDLKAQSILAEAFPDREIVPIQTLQLNFLGGGIHCMTQQEPRVP